MKENVLMRDFIRKPRQKLFFEIFGFALTIYFPLQCFFDSGIFTSLDYANHLWSANYYGDYFINNHGFPETFSTFNVDVGVAYPLFYGGNFYRLMGIINAYIFKDIQNTFKVVLLIFASLNFYAIYKILICITKSRLIAYVVTAIATFSIYPLTNLYNRGALTEWIAASVFNTAVMFWLLSICDAKEKNKLIIYKFAFMFLMIFLIDIHPITTLYSFFIFVLILIFSIKLLISRKDVGLLKLNVICSLVTFVIVIICNMKYAYRIVAFSKYIKINDTPLGGIPGVDDLSVKLSVFPLDRRVFTQNAFEVSTPFLDAQINSLIMAIIMGVLMILCLTIYKEKLRKCTIRWANKYCIIFSAICLISAILLLLATSLIHGAFIINAAWLLHHAQFAYRFVNQINLLSLLSLMFLLSFVYKNLSHMAWLGDICKFKRYAALSMAVLFALAVSSVIVKQSQHTYTVYTHDAQRENEIVAMIDDVTNRPSSFYGYNGYLIPGIELTISETSRLPMRKVNFASTTETLVARVNLTETTLVLFDIYAFPWNYVKINNQLYSTSKLLFYNEKPAVILEKGLYAFEYVYIPDYDLKKIGEPILTSNYVERQTEMFAQFTEQNTFPNNVPEDVDEIQYEIRAVRSTENNIKIVVRNTSTINFFSTGDYPISIGVIAYDQDRLKIDEYRVLFERKGLRAGEEQEFIFKIPNDVIISSINELYFALVQDSNAWFKYNASIMMMSLPEEVELNIPLTADNPNQDSYLLDGWHGQEDGFRWTDQTARMIFHADDRYPVALTLEANTYGHSKDTRILVNGKLVDVVRPAGVCEVIIPKEVLHADGLQVIVFENTAAVSPLAMGESQDSRDLGISVNQIGLRTVK